GRPPGSRADERRQRILEVAVELFEEHGGSPAPMDAIAQAAGVTRTAIYHYFPTKHDLIRAVLMRTITAVWWKAAVEEGLTLPSFQDRIQLLLSSSIRSSVDTSGDIYFALVNVSREDEEIRGAVRSYRDDMRAAVRRLVVQSIADGLLEEQTDTDKVTDAILGLVWCVSTGVVHAPSDRVLREIDLEADLAAGLLDRFVRTARRPRPSGGGTKAKAGRSTTAR